MKVVAKTQAGLEKLLAREITALTGKQTTELKRAVSLDASMEDIYKMNYQCRLLLRALVEIKREKIKPNEQAVYDFIYEIDWSEYIDPSDSIAVDSVVYSDYFTHANYISLKTKDAIVDKIRDEKGDRPNVDTKNPDFRIHIHINGLHEVSVSLDSSGESLHKRGYRQDHYIAPINEVLAAGIIQISNWDQKETFYDPMCGSGTFVSEALMLSAKIPPRFLKPDFAFQKWKNFDQTLWLKVKQEADAAITMPACKIYAHDLAYKAFEVTKLNIRSLPFHQLIEVKQRNFLNRGGLRNIKKLIMNPPYDHRMSLWKVSEFYKNLADKLKTEYAGCEAWIITSNFEGMKSFGLRHTRKYPLFNGAIDCMLYQFNIYEGSKKRKYQNQNKKN